MTNHDGGPAFPHEVYDPLTRLRHPRQGMTMRQWYKGMAMLGLLAGRQNVEALLRRPTDASAGRRDYTVAECAGHAAALADAQLAEDADSAKGKQ